MVRCPPTPPTPPTPAADFNSAFLLLYARAFSIICEESLHLMLYARALRKIVAFDAIRKGFKKHM